MAMRVMSIIKKTQVSGFSRQLGFPFRKCPLLQIVTSICWRLETLRLIYVGNAAVKEVNLNLAGVAVFDKFIYILNDPESLLSKDLLKVHNRDSHGITHRYHCQSLS